MLDWHAAGSEEERIKLGICGRWQRPEPIEDDASSSDEAMNDAMQLDASDERADLAVGQSDLADLGLSDDEQEAERREQETVYDVLRPDNTLDNALDDAQQQQQEQIQAEEGVVTDDASRVMKLEELDTAEALRLASVQNNGVVSEQNEDAVGNELVQINPFAFAPLPSRF